MVTIQDIPKLQFRGDEPKIATPKIKLMGRAGYQDEKSSAKIAQLERAGFQLQQIIPGNVKVVSNKKGQTLIFRRIFFPQKAKA